MSSGYLDAIFPPNPRRNKIDTENPYVIITFISSLNPNGFAADRSVPHASRGYASRHPTGSDHFRGSESI